MLASGQFTVFDHLNDAGVPLRASSRFGDDMAAALWDRDERAATTYSSPSHHTVSLYVDGGEGIRRRLPSGDGIASYGPGSVCLMPAGITTQWEVSGRVKLFHLYVPKRAFDRFVAETLDRDPARTQLNDVPFIRDATIENVIRHAVLPFDWNDPADRIAVSQAGQLLLTYVASRFAGSGPVPAARGGLSPNVVARITEYVDASLERPLAIGDLARVAQLSPFHFARMFRQATGESPHNFVLGRRIARARDLIAARQLPLAEIALACGFSGQSHLTERFRRATGITPGQYARHLRAG